MTTKSIIRNRKQPLERITLEEIRETLSKVPKTNTPPNPGNFSPDEVYSGYLQSLDLSFWRTTQPGLFKDVEKAAHSKGKRIATPSEFLAFLKDLVQYKSKEHFDATFKQKNGASYWLDMRFENLNDRQAMLVAKYHIFDSNNKIILEVKVADINREMQPQYVSLWAYLSSSTPQGLLRRGTSTKDSKDLMYYPPSNNCGTTMFLSGEGTIVNFSNETSNKEERYAFLVSKGQEKP